jgi:hypothetical protein
MLRFYPEPVCTRAHALRTRKRKPAVSERASESQRHETKENRVWFKSSETRLGVGGVAGEEIAHGVCFGGIRNVPNYTADSGGNLPSFRVIDQVG